MVDNHLSSTYDNRRCVILSRLYLSTYVVFFISLSILCNQGIITRATFVDSSTLKPSIILILPQSFKVPTDRVTVDDQDQSGPSQYVAVINNVHNEHNNELLRQQYNKLSLQVRDASSPITGQLFYEHVFDYFPSDAKSQHLLIPINLDQVSPIQEHRTGSRSLNDFTSPATSHKDDHPLTSASKPQRLIVSLRPYQLDSGFGSENIEFVSSSPVPVEPVLTNDGRRSFAVVQTDKPIYKPDDKVRIRAIVINENLRPVTKDEFRLQVRNPHKIIVEEIRVPVVTDTKTSSQNDSLYLDHVFEFPPEPMFGFWSVHVAHSDPIANDTTSFEVREYVAPSYGIEFDSPKYILPGTQTIVGSIYAKYHHGKPVQGKVQFKFGYRDSPSSKPRYVARSTIKDVNSSTGRVDYKINTTKFQEMEWFPNIAGSHFVVEATVTEMSTGHREVSEDSSCIFLTYPYRFLFEDSIEIFKPGLSQQLTVQVLEMQSGKPPPSGSRIIVQYTDQNGTLLNRLAPSESFNEKDQSLEDENFTDPRGRANFNIGPMNDNITWIQATFRFINSTLVHKGDIFRKTTSSVGERLKSHSLNIFNELAYGQHGLSKHESKTGWISIANKNNTEVRVGDLFTSDVLIRGTVSAPNRLYYMIVSRGQIVSLATLNDDGVIRFVITDSMIPSIRLVLFALNSGNPSLLSDSMRINVEQNLDCGLKIRFEPEHSPLANKSYYPPNSKGKLSIDAREGDLVSLIGVDSSIYSLNNRSHLDASRIVQRIKRLDLGCGFGGGVNDLDVFHNSGLMLFDQVTNQESSLLQPQLGSLCMTVLNQLKYLEDLQHGYSRPMFSAASQRVRPIAIGHPTNIRNQNGRISRSKRDLDVEPLINRYKNPMYRACCRLGTLEDLPQQRNCTERAGIVHKYVRLRMDLRTCSAVYFDCCRIVFREEVVLGAVATRAIPLESTPNLYLTSQSIPNIGQLDKVEAETLVRKDFRETWLFELVEVNQPDGKASIDVQLPHSITQWSLSAMSLNKFKPMCIMPHPLKLVSFQDIHIRLSIPFRIVQSEQMDLVATIFNYSPEEQEVFVYMYGVEDVCSEADPEERSERKVLRIAKQSSQSVVFPIIPLRTGTYPFKVIATTPSGISDIVQRNLNVVPKGRPVTDEITFSLDPMNLQRRNKRAIQTGNLLDEIDSAKGLQRSIVRLNPSRDSEYIVPQTQEYVVSAIGDKLGQTVQTSIIDVENLIRLPRGCGEQVMIYLGPTLYTARYLSSINKLTGDTRWRAIRYIQSGYKRILNYRKENGAFSAFARRDPSIWLTAFISKMLCQTERTPFVAEEVHVDKTVVNFALLWLINAQNKETGTWVEVNPVYHREMLGGVLKENALTSFVTLTLNECVHHSPDLLEESDYDHKNEQSSGDKLRSAIKKAEQALILDRYKAVKEKNPYVLALTAYALSFSRPQDAVLILNDLILFAERSQSRNQLYWRGDYQVETAAYALQALVELAPFLHNGGGSKSGWSPGTDAMSIVNFLTSKRTYSGAFESTQDTVVALEALSKFAQLQSSPGSSSFLPQNAISAPSLTCNVTINNRTRRSIEFDKNNAQIMQTFKLSPSDFESGQGEMLDIFTSGDGLGTMSVKLKYNVFQEDDELCRFNIDSSIEEWRPVIKMPSKDVESAHDKIDDGYFQNFDEAMLKELNLINPNDSSKSQNRDNRLPSTSREMLRFRRDSPRVLELNSTQKPDTWGLSKVVSSIKAKLPTIFSSSRRTSTTTTTTPRPTTTLGPIDQLTSLVVPRKYNTSRRSAQSTLTPTTWSPRTIADEPAGIPVDAKLNPLSKELRLNNTGTKNTSANSLEQEQRLILLLRVCVHHMSSRRDSEMAVLEIGILSGFRPNEADLVEIVKDLETPAMKYEISSDRSLVVIYLQYIPSSGPYCIQFRQIRESLVSNLQPGYIRAYEYYTPSHSCANYYTPTRITDLIKTKCDASGQVCQCMTKSICPASNKLLELNDLFIKDVAEARKSFINLVCSRRHDFVAFVSLKNVRYIEAANSYKLTVRVKSDIKGNLTKLMDLQKEQKKQWPSAKQRPYSRPSSLPFNSNFNQSEELRQLEEDDTSLDYLNLNIDAGCIRGEPLLYHFAHPNHWRQGGSLMILFGRYRKLDKHYYVVTPNMVRLAAPGRTTSFPQPKPNIISSADSSSRQPSRQDVMMENKIRSAQLKAATFEEPVQYSTTMNLDKDSILHDLIYSKEAEPRSAINSLVLWLDLRVRHEKWTCGSDTA